MADYNKPIELPNTFTQELQSLLDNLEAQTGERYEISVHKQGTYSNNDRKFGDLAKRNKYLVYNMVTDHDKEIFLNGGMKYDDNYVSLKPRHRFVDEKVFKLLKELEGEYNSIEEIEQKKKDLENMYLADKDRYKTFNILNNLNISASTGHIYHSDGGSISICSTLGYIKIV